MKKHRRLAARITNLLVVKLVNRRDLKSPRVEGLDRRIKDFHIGIIRRVVLLLKTLWPSISVRVVLATVSTYYMLEVLTWAMLAFPHGHLT